MNSRESQLLDTRKTLCIGSPLLCGTFITTNMDVVIGEDVGNIVQHTLEKINHSVIADIEHVMRDTAIHTHLVLFGGVTTEFGIRSNSCHHMAREVYLGNDLNIACFGIGYYFAQFFLAIPHATTVFCIIIKRLAVTNIRERCRTNGTNLRELGIFWYLHAPTLVVGQMPMEAIHLVKRHDI